MYLSLCVCVFFLIPFIFSTLLFSLPPPMNMKRHTVTQIRGSHSRLSSPLPTKACALHFLSPEDLSLPPPSPLRLMSNLWRRCWPQYSSPFVFVTFSFSGPRLFWDLLLSVGIATQEATAAAAVAVLLVTFYIYRKSVEHCNYDHMLARTCAVHGPRVDALPLPAKTNRFCGQCNSGDIRIRLLALHSGHTHPIPYPSSVLPPYAASCDRCSL